VSNNEARRLFGLQKFQGGKQYLSDGLVAARYRRHVRTIKRWRADPRVKFPKHDIEINGHCYTLPETLDRFDAAQAVKQA
jgi:hypothetical protein